MATQQGIRTGFVPRTFNMLLENYPSGEFEGRQSLFERIWEIIAERERAIITLAAGAGIGKTAFLLKFIANHEERSLGAGRLAAWHILRKDQPDWLPTAALAGRIE